jgi:hypothetical protein
MERLSAMVCSALFGLAIAAAREAMADGLAGGRWFGRGAVAARECRLAFHALWVAGQQLGGGDRPDAALVKQRRVKRADHSLQFVLVIAGTRVQVACAAREITEDTEDQLLAVRRADTAHPHQADGELGPVARPDALA